MYAMSPVTNGLMATTLPVSLRDPQSTPKSSVSRKIVRRFWAIFQDQAICWPFSWPFFTRSPDTGRDDKADAFHPAARQDARLEKQQPFMRRRRRRVFAKTTTTTSDLANNILIDYFHWLEPTLKKERKIDDQQNGPLFCQINTIYPCCWWWFWSSRQIFNPLLSVIRDPPSNSPFLWCYVQRKRRTKGVQSIYKHTKTITTPVLENCAPLFSPNPDSQ